MTFDEMLQQRPIVVEVEPPQKQTFTRAFALGAIYKVDCPDGPADHMHGDYIRIISIAQTRIRYERLTPAEHYEESNDFAPNSYFAEWLRFAYSNIQEYQAMQAI